VNPALPPRVARRFAVQDGDYVVAAVILFPDGNLVTTWASHEMIRVMVDGLARLGIKLASVLGPHHVSWEFAKEWQERTGQGFQADREERVYQLSRLTYTPPETGRLELATDADKSFLTPWIEGFLHDAEYETGGYTVQQLLDSVIATRTLYLWKAPEPKAMAAWANSTRHGAVINFVYVPPALRGQGYGKAVSAALAQKMLSTGQRYCFILTDTHDPRTNGLYQKIGARAVADNLRCKLLPAASTELSVPATGPRFMVAW
jgi:ribosomal protein S18 acetylase RimI-like enzyme